MEKPENLLQVSGQLELPQMMEWDSEGGLVTAIVWDSAPGKG